MTLPAGPNTDAWLVTAAEVPAFAVGASTAGLIATGSQTDRHYGLFRWGMSGSPGGATPHYHRTFSEAFYVLEGRVSLYDGVDWRPAGPGDFLYVPPSGIHAFRNDSGEPVSMLIAFAPAPPREAYFRELAERIASGVTDDEKERRAFLARHDQYEV